MGSGKRFEITRADKGTIALGIAISQFPHAVSIGIAFFVWDIYIGFGKGYDE